MKKLAEKPITKMYLIYKNVLMLSDTRTDFFFLQSPFGYPGVGRDDPCGSLATGIFYDLFNVFSLST